jgi:hypothetical protein
VSRSTDRKVEVVEGQVPAFDEPEPEPPVRQFAYTCRSCGSPNLTGLHTTTDSSDRWRIADQCNGCGKAEVIAERR